MRDLVRAALAGYVPAELPLGDRRESAVLVLLHEHEGVEHVLFQVRSASMAMHSGQISFPGGGLHAGDATLLETALREVEEEIGVPRAHVEVFGRLDDATTQTSHYRIRPYVGALERGPRDFAVDAGEVHELLAIPLPFLLSPESRGWYPVDRGGALDASPAYFYGDHVVWGATARVLACFLSVIDAAP